MSLLLALWVDEMGAVISAELVFVLTFLVIGMIIGLQNVRDAVTQELTDIAVALDHISQSWGIHGNKAHGSSTAGATFVDETRRMPIARG